MSEIELKLQIPAQKKNQIIKALHTLEAENIALHAQYFDTPEFELAQNHTAIRLRKEGAEWVQTLKGASADAMQRYELEFHRGASESAPLLCLDPYKEDKQAYALLSGCIDHPDQLIMQFETVVKRTFKVVPYHSSDIEICLDLGYVGKKGQQENICEIEFELKSGCITDLIEFTQQWVKKYSIWLDVRSKAERGHLIAREKKVSPAPYICHLKIKKKQMNRAILEKLIAQYTQPLLPCTAAIADQVAELAHYQCAETALSHLIQVITVAEIHTQKSSGLNIARLKTIKQQLSDYISLFELDQNVQPHVNDTFKGLTQPLLQMSAQLAHTMMSVETTTLLLQLLDSSHVGIKNFNINGGDFLQQLEYQYATLLTTSKNQTINHSDISRHDLKIYQHYLAIKKDKVNTALVADIEHHKTQQLLKLLSSVKMLKTDQNFLMGWLSKQLVVQQEYFLKRLKKI